MTVETIEVYEDLCEACDIRGLVLELYVARQLVGADGPQWRELERLDVVDGRVTIVSALIVPPAGIAGAAAVALERLTRSRA